MDKKTLKSSHSSRVYDNFLVHWKYIKREKIAGAKKGESQWKYFYKDDKATDNKPGIVDKVKDKLGVDEREAYEKAKSQVETARANVAKAQEKVTEAQRDNAAAQQQAKSAKTALDTAKKKLAETTSAYSKATSTGQEIDKITTRIEYEDARYKYNEASKEYLDRTSEATNTKSEVAKQKSEYQESKNELTKDLADYNKAKTAYENTLAFKVSELSESAKDRIDSGRDAVSNLLDKFDPAVRKERKEAEAAAARAAAEAYAEQARQDALDRGEEVLSDFPMKTEEYTKDEDQAVINPRYEEGPEWQNNCAYCTAAYDLRRRGYDVAAMPCDFDTYDATLDTIAEWYENTTEADWEKNEAVLWLNDDSGLIKYDEIPAIHDATKKVFEEMPDDSYGQFCVYWTEGGGHSMVWEKENGTTYIRDCQTGEKYTHDQWVYWYGDYACTSYVLRTDNRTPSANIKVAVESREDAEKRRDESVTKTEYIVGNDKKKKPRQFYQNKERR